MKSLGDIFYKRGFIIAVLCILLMVIPCWGQDPGPIEVTEYTIDDDEDQWADDHSEGDNDRLIEQGETIRLDIFLKNNGTAKASDVQATISTNSNWVTITNTTRAYEDIEGGEEKSSAGIWRNGFHFIVVNDAPAIDVTFEVQITTGNAGSYADSVVVSIKGGGTPGPISISKFIIDDDEEIWASDNSEGDNDKIPEQGETIRMEVTLLNSGSAPAFDVNVTISTTSQNVNLTKSTSNYAVLGDNAPESNAGIWRDGFHFTVNLDAESEDLLFVLDISTRNAGSFSDTIIVHVEGGGTPGPIKFESFKIDDDDDNWADDNSKGDGDGIIEQGETIRMPISIINEGSAPAFNVTATINTISNNVTITEASANYGVLGDGESENNEGIWRDGFHFKVHTDAQTEDVVFILNMTTRNSGTFIDSFKVSLVGGGIVGPIEVISFEIDDDDNRWADDHSSGNGDGIINENESIRLAVTLGNIGTATALDVSGTLSTDEPLITITQATKSFGSIGADEQGDNVGIWRDGFHFTVASSIPNKDVRFDLAISTSDGKAFSDSIILAIGTETDQSPPIITIFFPLESIPVPVRRFPIEIAFSDGLYGSGIDTSSIWITNNKDIGINESIITAGTDLSEFFMVSDSSAVFQIPDSLEFPLGENKLTVKIGDKSGNVGEASRTFYTSYFGLLDAADSAYVNISPFSLTGYAVQKYVHSIEVNGSSVSIIDDQFQIDIPLSLGVNIIEVTAYDQSLSEIGSEQFILIYDNIPPLISINSPSEGAVLKYSPVTVSGSVTDQNPFRVILNGRAIDVIGNNFEEEIEIDEGENIIQVSAIDSAGNRRDVNINVFAQPPESPIGKLQLYIKDNVLSKFPFEPYPPNTTLGYHVSYVFGTNSWGFILAEDIAGIEYQFSLLVGCYGLGQANMICELVTYHAGEETIIATTPEFVGNMAGPTPFGYFSPSRKDFTITGIDPQTEAGDTLILRIKKVGGDRVGLIFIRELNKGHSWITIPKNPVDVPVNIAQLPTEYCLSQNFPNPFNPETYIKYQLPRTSEIKLEIYNLLGQKVATLVDKKQSSGYYSIKWNGRDDMNRKVASGVYLYRLQTKEFVSVRKLTLVQ